MKSNYLSELQSRRRFIRQMACAGVGTIAMSNVLRDMSFINRALAQSSISSGRCRAWRERCQLCEGSKAEGRRKKAKEKQAHGAFTDS